MIRQTTQRYFELTRQSLKLAWVSFRSNLALLSEHESSALHGYMDDARARAVIASQAGDVATLLRDQLELLPQSQKRIRQNRNAVLAIARNTLSDWVRIAKAYWHALQSG